jgi:hypothetical protein
MRRFPLVLTPWLFVSACLASPPARVEPVVYGNDDRREVYDHPDPVLRARARDAIVALVPAHAIDTSDPSDVRLLSRPLSETQQLCAGQRFADQPTAANCSGTLIDDDLVLTAGHCLADQAECEGTRFVFDYFYEGPAALANISRRDVYGCRRLVVRALDGGSRDYAVVQLDRPATADGRVPAPVRTASGPVTAGAGLAILGFGSGLPEKIDTGGRVLDPRARTLDYFTATTDSFGGNSGSGVFDLGTGELVGALVRGDQDYIDAGGCFVVNALPERPDTGGESVAYVRHALDALCASWPSTRLCGAASRCGDGFCAGGETSASCPSDCGASRCGDGVCDLSEDASGCPADCEATIPTGPPPGWTCPPGWWNAREGCDCACGVRDPDCDVPGQRVFRCGDGQTCDAAGRCVEGGGTWFCPASYYGTRDGCDCECGAYDPDCDDASQAVLNCPEGYACGAGGRCVDAYGDPPRWLCATDTRRGGGGGLALLVASGLALVFVRRARSRAGGRARVARPRRGLPALSARRARAVVGAGLACARGPHVLQGRSGRPRSRVDGRHR